MVESLSPEQLRIIIIIERAASVLSLIGCTFVITTFCTNDKFRKSINRLVFFATFGNILTNIATLISTTGIEAGAESSLCQFQAFLIQWFMPADAYWTFAMACNVYLSFFRSYDIRSLRRIEWRYLVGCYGVPLILSIVLLFVRTATRGKAYGNAVLWCWISLEWDILRVATFYGPVWVLILCTMGIYIKVGSVIFKFRRQLLKISKQNLSAHESVNDTPGIAKTSEVTISASSQVKRGSGGTNQSDRPFSGYIRQKASFIHRKSPTERERRRLAVQRSGGIDPNKAALKYCKCALLFFIALIITWVPSTVNRIYTLFKPDEVVFGLNVAAATVLPLQGFWNTCIYMATSSYAVKSLWQDVCKTFKRKHAVSSTRPEVTQRSTERATELEEQYSATNKVRYDCETASMDS